MSFLPETELGLGLGEAYPLVQTLEELDFSVHGVHLGLQLHLAHVSRIHILRKSRDPMTSPFCNPRQCSHGNWYPSANSVASCLRERTQDQGPRNLTSTQNSLRPCTNSSCLWNSFCPIQRQDLFTASSSQIEGMGESPVLPTASVIQQSEPRAAPAICQRQAELEGKAVLLSEHVLFPKPKWA